MAVVPVVSVILVDKRGRVLLQLRDQKPELFPGCWTLPGGMVEPGETPLEAIIREMIEEIGFAPPMVLWKHYQAPRADFTVEQYLFVGVLPVSLRAITLSEGDAVAMFGRDAVEKLKMAFGYKVVLAEFFQVYATEIHPVWGALPIHYPT